MSVLFSRRSLAVVGSILLLGNACYAGGPITVWNSNLGKEVVYNPLSVAAKPGDWVWVDARKIHPTQFCLGYREVYYKSELFSRLPVAPASHDPTSSLEAYLARKDLPLIIGPDGTPYLTDGHHTMAALIASSQADKTTFGHIVANFYGEPQAEFVAFMTDPKNNDCYLYGPHGNGLLNAPATLDFGSLPTTVYSASPQHRMFNDPYRSLGWGMKGVGYRSKPGKSGREDELFENFIEFRWADLFRDKIVWNNDSDSDFYIAVQNADVLARSPETMDLSRGFAARDLPGFIACKPGEAFTLNITDHSGIRGDICPPPNAMVSLNVNTKSMLCLEGALSNLRSVRINGGGEATPRIDQGSLAPKVEIPAGCGTVVLAGVSSYAGPTELAAGQLMVNGGIQNSAVRVDAGATLRGVGRVGAISGGGCVWPGTTQGTLTGESIDGQEGMSFAFELTAQDPAYADALHARNDLLLLEGPKPFAHSLSASNDICVYIRKEMLAAGARFSGGFLVRQRSSFATDIAAARVHGFVTDPQGAVILGNTHYRSLEETGYRLSMDVVPVNAQELTAGYVTRFTLEAAK